nr:hypothetical protein [Clostridium kluyveri]
MNAGGIGLWQPAGWELAVHNFGVSGKNKVETEEIVICKESLQLK